MQAYTSFQTNQTQLETWKILLSTKLKILSLYQYFDLMIPNLFPYEK